MSTPTTLAPLTPVNIRTGGTGVVQSFEDGWYIVRLDDNGAEETFHPAELSPIFNMTVNNRASSPLPVDGEGPGVGSPPDDYDPVATSTDAPSPDAQDEDEEAIQAAEINRLNAHLADREAKLTMLEQAVADVTREKEEAQAIQTLIFKTNQRLHGELRDANKKLVQYEASQEGDTPPLSMPCGGAGGGVEPVEVKTLIQQLRPGQAETIAKWDAELAQTLSDGWTILNITVNTTGGSGNPEHHRIVTLSRPLQQPDDTPEDETTAAATAPQETPPLPVDGEGPGVGLKPRMIESVTIIEPAIETDEQPLPVGSITALLASGVPLDQIKDAMDGKARAAGAAAFNQSGPAWSPPPLSSHLLDSGVGMPQCDAEPDTPLPCVTGKGSGDGVLIPEPAVVLAPSPVGEGWGEGIGGAS